MRLVRCPACGARHKIPDTASGKRARCKRCGKPFLVPDRQPDSGRLSLTRLEPPSGDTPPAQPAAPADPLPLAPAGPEPAATMPVGHVPLRVEPEAASGGGGYTVYFRLLGTSLLFFTRGNNLTSFIVMLIVLVVGEVATFGLQVLGCAGLIAQLLVWLIVIGWYLSFQLKTVQNAAGGEEDLPTVSLTGGWMEDIITPFFKMLVVNLVTYLPAVIFLASAGALSAAIGGPATGGAGGGGFPFMNADAKTLVIGAMLLLGGLFLLPMFILVVAVGSVGALVRMDLIVTTVIRSLPAYVITVLAVYACRALDLTAWVLIAMGESSVRAGTSDVTVISVLLLAGLIAAQLYLTIIAMRAIGLYYHSFKHQFAWSWG